MKFFCNAIGVTVYAGLWAVIAYAIAPAQTAFVEATTVFIGSAIFWGVFVYFHPGPIVADVP